MRKGLIIVMSLLLSLTACEDMSDITTATKQEIQEFMYGKPEPKPEPIVLESRYCYKARGDVLCYDSPQVGKEDQFIGSQ